MSVDKIVSELRVRFMRLLSPSLCPAKFFFVDRLPALPSGKYDRRAIKSLASEMVSKRLDEQHATHDFFNKKSHALSHVSISSWTPLQLHVASLASTVLSIEPGTLELHANLLSEYGANSLSLARLLFPLRASTGCADLSLALVFRHASVGELSTLLPTLPGFRASLFVDAACLPASPTSSATDLASEFDSVASASASAMTVLIGAGAPISVASAAQV